MFTLHLLCTLCGDTGVLFLFVLNWNCLQNINGDGLVSTNTTCLSSSIQDNKLNKIKQTKQIYT